MLTNTEKKLGVFLKIDALWQSNRAGQFGRRCLTDGGQRTFSAAICPLAGVMSGPAASILFFFFFYLDPLLCISISKLMNVCGIRK